MTHAIKTAARSITGRRQRNEDTYFVDPESNVFAVLDGDITSSTAAKAFEDFYATIAKG